MSLNKLNKVIQSCKKCNLWKTRVNAVPGEGSPDAKIFFLGQAPGRNEDLQGRPFVGLAGKFLNKLLDSIDLKREEVFITGAVKCFPPKNRKPAPAEVKACKPYLLKQIEITNPKLIVLLGDTALETLLRKGKVSELHGKIAKKDRTYFITFHPAAAMRFPKIRNKMIEDFEKLKDLCKKIKQ